MQASLRFRRFILIGVVAAVSMLGVFKIAEACSHAPPTPPVLCIERIDATHFCILIKNYTTAGGALPGQFCTCALRRLGVIVSIDSFQMFFCNSNMPVPGWNFTPNTNSSAAWTTLLGGPATGFFSNVGIPIPLERCIDLKFIITVAPTTTAPQLASALAAAGPLIGNGEANSMGVPLPGSFDIRPAGPIMIIAPTCPADFNGDGAVSTQDLFDYLAAFFTPGSLAADFNHNGVVTSQDLFDFLAAFFTPCP